MKITLDTFVISDTHFGHNYILQKEPARMEILKDSYFKTFDDLSIKYWNDTVRKKDKVLHLGDLYFKNGIKCLASLNGKKMLVVGNNDIGKYEKLKNLDDWKVVDKIKFKLDDKKYFKDQMKKKWGDKLKNKFANALIAKVDNYTIMFSHFPVHERRRNERYSLARDIIDYAYDMSECNLNIHGHLHSRDSVKDYCINVSIERINFKPLKLREILY